MEKNKSSKLTEEKRKQIISGYENETEKMQFNFVIKGKPVPYARARFARAGRFVHCYNPKASIEENYKVQMKSQLDKKTAAVLNALLANENSDYTAEVDGEFYVPISKSETIANSALQEAKLIRPAIRNGDIDNYMKLVLDAMHGVVYNDDKIVTSIKAEKFYSYDPRSELKITLTIHHKAD